MDSLFSHSGEPRPVSDVGTPPLTVTAEVIVPRSTEDAFAGFTDGIHLWWPADQTHFGEGTHPEFTGGELFEDEDSGESHLWATVLEAPSNGELRLAWHHQGNPHRSSHVAVSFMPEGAGTRVSVVHDGWAEGEPGHEQFTGAPDWPTVLASYARFMGAAR